MGDFSELEKIITPLYQVGGSVRDEILGVTPKDYDFATSLTPDEIESRLRQAGKKPYTFGKRFGTVGTKVDGHFVEITTFRQERYHPGSRKPDVAFVTDLTEDLSRRDFTINAIAKEGSTYIDPFDGQNDIQDRLIRAVGKPKERFSEDPLRMLRAARFVAQLGFTVEEETLQSIATLASKILEVSKERWTQELDLLLLSEKPSFGLDILAQTRLLNFMLPELSLQVDYDQNTPYHAHRLWEHTKRTVDLTPIDINLRWTALLHDIAKPFVRSDKVDRSNYIHHDLLGAEMVIKLGKYLHWSRERIQRISELVATHLSADNPLRPFDNAAK